MCGMPQHAPAIQSHRLERRRCAGGHSASYRQFHRWRTISPYAFGSISYRISHRTGSGTGACLYQFCTKSRGDEKKLNDNMRRTEDKSHALKIATDRVLEVEGYLSDAVASLPDGFVLYDQNDQIVLCNDKYREIYATSADLIVPGNRFEDIIREGVARGGQYPNAMKDPEAWIERRMEFHYHPSGPIEQKLDDGRWLRVFEQQTERGQIVGFRVDITELKEREQALAFSESQLRATMESALDGIIVIDEQGLFKSSTSQRAKYLAIHKMRRLVSFYRI